MAWKLFKFINILAVFAVLFIAAFSWLYLPREQLMWSVYLIILVILLTVYANIRGPLMGRIEARRKVKNKPVDVEKEKRLRALNYGAMIAVLAIAVLTWAFLPREQFTWAAILIALILLVIGLIDVRWIISDIS